MTSPKINDLVKKLNELNYDVNFGSVDPKNLHRTVLIIDSSRYLGLQPIVDMLPGLRVVEIAKPDIQGTIPSLREGRDLTGLLSEYLTANSQTPSYMILRDETDEKHQVEIRIGDKEKVPK